MAYVNVIDIRINAFGYIYIYIYIIYYIYIYKLATLIKGDPKVLF